MNPPFASDRFKAVRQLGEGGMGVVYEVLDAERHTRSALKTLRVLSPDAVLRLKNEFRAIRDLHHENLVALGELVLLGGTWAFTMELVHGESFLAYARPGAPLHVHDTVTDTMRAESFALGPAPVAVRISEPAPPLEVTGPPALDEARLRPALVQVVSGLDALHRAGLVHRDVKPSNVLVTTEGRVVLLDFGLVTVVGDADEAPSIGGTAPYMAPEQASLGPVGPPADYYALGVMLFEALTGTLPFTGSPLDILMDKIQRPAPRSRERDRSVPEDLDELCADLLRFDPVARPGVDEVLRRLGAQQAPRTSFLDAAADGFVGREAELRALEAAFDETASGGTITVLVEGPSGVGKTAILKRFCEGLARRAPGTLILAGRCHERELVPYKAVDGVVDALSRALRKRSKVELEALLPPRFSALAKVFPVLQRIDAPWRFGREQDAAQDRSDLFATMRELFQRLAKDAVVVVTIDDLQWADGDSLAMLGDVMASPGAPRLLLVATTRSAEERGSSGEAPSAPRSADFQGDVRRIAVTGLPSDEARELCAKLLRRAGAREGVVDQHAISSAAEGHPLFIDALVRHALTTGVFAPTSVALDDAIAARVMALEALPRRLLEVVAIAVAPLAQRVAAEAAELDLEERERAIGALRVAHLARTTGTSPEDAIEIYHDRVRAALATRLGADVKKRHHARIASAIEASGAGESESLVVHHREAGNTARAAELAERAAVRALAALAIDRAVGLYRIAIDCTDPASPRVPLLHGHLGQVLGALGKNREATRELLLGAERAGELEATELRRVAAEFEIRAGRLEEGLAILKRVLAETGVSWPKTPLVAVARLLFWRAWIFVTGYGFREDRAPSTNGELIARVDACGAASAAMGLVDPVRGAYFQAKHFALARRTGDAIRMALAFAMEAVATASRGQAAAKKADALIVRARALTRTSSLPVDTKLDWFWIRAPDASILAMSAYASLLAGVFRSSAERALEAERLLLEQSRLMTSTWAALAIRLIAATSLAYLGRLRELRPHVLSTLPGIDERGDFTSGTDMRAGSQNLAWLAFDEVELAREHLRLAIERWSPPVYGAQHFRQLIAGVQLELYVEDGRAALDLVEAKWPALARSMSLRVQFVRIIALDLRARSLLAVALATPQGSAREALLGRATRDARSLGREESAWGAAVSALLLGLVARARGEDERAAKLLAEALGAFEGEGMTMHAAAVQDRLARLVPEERRRALLEASGGWIASQGIPRPERLFAMLAPFAREP